MFGWYPEPLFVAGSIAAVLIYGAGIARLRRRGDKWPIGRTLAWLAGVASVLLSTSSGLAAYGTALFSVHMIQHMILSMLSPILLLLGAPITLALRSLKPAGRDQDGNAKRGPREILLAVLHSRFAAVMSSPAVTLPLFIASLYVLYFTPLFDLAMGNMWGHRWMMIHFLAVGLLFFWPIMGIDPAPRKHGYVMKMLELFAGMPFHAFFGVAVMMSSSLIVDSFAKPPAAWGTDVLADQQMGGGIAWAFGEVPTVIVLLVIFSQWMRSEERLARRKDRAADRDGDAELDAYNAYLARLGGSASAAGKAADEAADSATDSAADNAIDEDAAKADAAAPTADAAAAAEPAK
ncbi:cytochrome c oxidase assembly protein [Yinghuangia sp. KLBMP8922]|uniref:Cytochrome c oxidase assembly protein n=2 Tax=Yinghuangia soli TaxID=2908204 RepID=A0AA41U3I0_9ACTN|nr:cytochrome c oxidase assembly protein [Yinghuangia soli]MCF2528074.1 cytochrome c oxidase assembly protein [Yinghuangia soli]